MTRPDHRSPGRGPPVRKSVLFCPACGHESLVGGDWIVRETREAHATVCPDCENVVTERPAPGEPREPIEAGAAGASTPVSAAVVADDGPWSRYWSAWTRAWTHWLRARA